MKCLDTYALIEIALGNPKFSSLVNEECVITDITIAEFYFVILQRYNEKTAQFWYKKFESYCTPVFRDILIKAVEFRNDNKKEELSFFDCVGYMYALTNNFKFVTGDKAFKNRECVLFIQK